MVASQAYFGKITSFFIFDNVIGKLNFLCIVLSFLILNHSMLKFRSDQTFIFRESIKVKAFMLQKRLMNSFNLSIGQKMLRLRKMAAENLKNGKVSFGLVTLNFQELFSNKLDSKSNWLKKKLFICRDLSRTPLSRNTYITKYYQIQFRKKNFSV